MRNHTTDPGERAASIANYEAEKVWEETKSFKEYLDVWFSIYNQSLLEFVYEVSI